MEKIIHRYQSLYGLGPLLGFLLALFLSTFFVSFHCGHWIGWMLISPQNDLFSFSLRKRHGGGILETILLLSILYIPALIIWKTSSGRFHRIKRVNSVSSDIWQDRDWEDIYKEIDTATPLDDQPNLDKPQQKTRNVAQTSKPMTSLCDTVCEGKCGKASKGKNGTGLSKPSNICISPCEVSLSSVLLSVLSSYEHLGQSYLLSYGHNKFQALFKNVYFFYRIGVYLTLFSWHLFVAYLQMLRITLFSCIPPKPPGLEETEYMDVWKKYNRKFSLYEKLPNKIMSWHWGYFHNQVEMPHWVRVPLLSLYSYMFGCKVNEASIEDLKQYRNLSEFFRRDLKPGLRPISYAHQLTSPADGTVLHCCKVKNGSLEQVKGVFYSMKGFLGEYSGKFAEGLPKVKINNKNSPTPTIHTEECHSLNNNIEDLTKSKTLPQTDLEYAQSLVTKPGNCLYQCIIYLSPGDYHKFHSPADWTALSRRHIPGELFSVHPSIARWLQGLFNFNERVIYSGKWEHGFFSFSAVGATNVGSIDVYFDKGIATNLQEDNPVRENLDEVFDTKKKNKSSFKRGQIFGEFNLGSSIVLLFEAPNNFKFNVKPGDKVAYGQGLGFTRKHKKGSKKT